MPHTQFRFLSRVVQRRSTRWRIACARPARRALAACIYRHETPAPEPLLPRHVCRIFDAVPRILLKPAVRRSKPRLEWERARVAVTFPVACKRGTVPT